MTLDRLRLKTCKIKAKLCPNCNNSNYSGNYPKSIWKCTNYGGNHSAVYKGCSPFKSAISKSMDRKQNLSYVQAMCRRAAKEQIKAFKANVI